MCHSCGAAVTKRYGSYGELCARCWIKTKRLVERIIDHELSVGVDVEDIEPTYPSSLRYRLTCAFLHAVDEGKERHARWCWEEDDRRVALGIPRAMAWDGVFAPNGENRIIVTLGDDGEH